MKGIERIKRRRDKLRAAGLRPVQIWVPDTRSREFAEAYAEQARVVAAGEDQAETEAWSEISDTTGWTA